MHAILGPKPQIAQQRRERLAASGGAPRPEVNLASLNDTASDRAPDTESPDAKPDGLPRRAGNRTVGPPDVGPGEADRPEGNGKRTCRS